MADVIGPYYSLGQDVNKVKDPQKKEVQEGVVTPLLPELELSMSDDDLLSLKKKWEKAYKQVSGELEKNRKTNEEYYLGKHFNNTEDQMKARPLADNIIWEATETWLPLATRQNPEAFVLADNTSEGIAVSDTTQKMLAYQADRLSLKLKLKRAARHWSLYFVGAAKIGWSEIENDVDLKVIRPHKLILDPDSTIEECEYTGEYIGEVRRDTADRLIIRFPKKKSFITEKVDGKMGTELQYTEWWTDKFVFWTMEEEVLDKKKNPHWNYESEQEQTDQMGVKTMMNVPGMNHFPAPRMPYVLLSVYNLGLRPFDDTVPIQQNMSIQDMINKRLKQIDRNIDDTNGGIVLSGDHFTKEAASEASTALRRGKNLWVPRGDVNTAYKRDSGVPLPREVYESLQDYRNVIRGNIGVAAFTGPGLSKERSARGKQLRQQQDMDRAGGFSEYLEQFADKIYNYFVQMFYVYYDDQKSAAIVGKEKGVEYITLKKADLNRKLTVSVREGSLIPKDPITKRQEAIELWGAGALDPISLFMAMDFPNPRESAKTLFLWKSNPQALFPDLAQPPPPPAQPQQLPANLPVTQ